MEYIELGPVPAGEPCAQVGTDNYLARSMRECEVFRRMLERVLPIPEGLPVKYVVRSHPHDFGTYREVSVQIAIKLADGDFTAVQGIMTGTFSKPMDLGNGKQLQPTGKTFTLPMMTVARWENGRMKEEWLFWDNAAFMTQIGAAP